MDLLIMFDSIKKKKISKPRQDFFQNEMVVVFENYNLLKENAYDFI
jgi:hypothetical protein